MRNHSLCMGILSDCMQIPAWKWQYVDFISINETALSLIRNPR